VCVYIYLLALNLCKKTNLKPHFLGTPHSFCDQIFFEGNVLWLDEVPISAKKMKCQLGRNSAHPNCPVLVSPVRLSGPSRRPRQHPVQRRGRRICGGAPMSQKTPCPERRLRLFTSATASQRYKETSILLLLALFDNPTFGANAAGKNSTRYFLKEKTELCTPSLDYNL
jgi:hypothetical protein